MNLLTIILIGIGLSMDAFAVSVAKGMCVQKNIGKTALKLGLWFGFFQALMPLLGWWAGIHFQSMIESIDHWIAFGLLGIIGLNMIRESLKEEESNGDVCIKTLFILAIATSIDALAIGISFAFLQVNITIACITIGLITFALSCIATVIGNKIGGILQKYAGMIGGFILILIGFKILIEHLFLS